MSCDFMEGAQLISLAAVWIDPHPAQSPKNGGTAQLVRGVLRLGWRMAAKASVTLYRKGSINMAGNGSPINIDSPAAL
jgi:hypothetical protein